ncbi:unnamed protein product [Oreochromis niloticus]|nr:unnamed protein product [Mustela putorius furo]
MGFLHQLHLLLWKNISLKRRGPFADDTVVLGAISNNDEAAYMDEVKNLASWCRDNHLQLNVGKTKELVVDFRRSQHRDYKPIIINGAPVESVQSFKYLGVHISSDLTWSAHIQVQTKKARQRLYHLRQLRKFRVSPEILRTFYTGAVESILTQNITFWYGNSCVKDKKALQRVICMAERFCRTALPSLQDIYVRRCWTRATQILKDPSHPSNELFQLLKSGRSEGSPPLSIRHGARVVAPQQYSVEQVLLAVGEQVGHENITYGSRMNKAVVAFLREERLVHLLVERGIVLDDLFVAVSPLFVPSTRVTVSGVPPFIQNELLEKERTRFGKFASGFRVVRLGCKDARLQHVQSLRRQAFMYLNDPSQTLEVSFKVRYENGLYTVYASAGSMKCFECGDVGHKRSSSPHKEQEVRGDTGDQEAHASGASGQERAVDAGTGEQPARSGADEQPSTSSAVIGEPLAAQGDRMEVAASAPQAALEEQGIVQGTNEVEDGCDDIQDGESVEETQDSGQTKATASEVGVLNVISGSLSAENEEDDLLEDDSLSQCSDVVSQEDHQQSYSLEDINRFLDETFGMQSVEVTEFFPDVDLFIKSVLKIRRVVGYEQLSKQKRFRLKKILTKLRREKRGKTPLKA